MSETFDDESGPEDAENEGLDPNIRKEIRKNRSLQKEAEAAKSENERLARELALVRAGIPDTPLGKFFTENFKGDASDPAAVRTEFEALNGPISGTGPIGLVPESIPAAGIPADELETHRRMAQAGSQSSGSAGGPIPLEQALKEAGAIMNKVEREAEILRIVGVAQQEHPEKFTVDRR